ncbi:MAG: sensor domain-containing diguanylate cyclase [Planctomycetota bacterium]
MSDLDRLQRHLDVLSEVGKITSASLSLDDVLAQVMAAVGRLFHPEDWSVLLVDEQTGGLSFALALGRAASSLKHLAVKPGEGVAGWVARHGQPVIVADARTDPRFERRFDVLSGFETRSLVAVPLRSRNRVVGVMELCNVVETGRFQQPDLDFLSLLCDYAGVAVDNARTHAQVLELSKRDPLSKLLNSTTFLKLLNELVERSGSGRTPLSLVFLDIDGFKVVVDTHGHLTGSRVLAEIGQRVREALEPPQQATRFGGDEFAIVLPALDRDAALAWAERLRAALRERPYQRDAGKEIWITASIGVATFPDDGTTGEDLLRAADAAMYRVKGSGKDACQRAR